jgi:hypothetical protein
VRMISTCACKSFEAVQGLVTVAKPEVETVRVPDDSGTFSKANDPVESVVVLAEYDLALS